MAERRDIDYDWLLKRLRKLNTVSSPDLVRELIEDAIDAIDTLRGDLQVANLIIAAEREQAGGGGAVTIADSA